MNKEDLLQELSVKINTGEIDREEILARLDLVSEAQAEIKKEGFASFSATRMLYALGAAVVVLGIVIFVSQIWDDMGSFGRISVTLVLGFLFAAIGSMLLKNKPEDKIGSIFHFIGGALIPGGAMVTLSEFSTGQNPLWPIAITFGIIFAFYLLVNAIHKNAVLTFFAIANGTIFVYRLVEAIIDGPVYDYGDLYAYLTMVIGASYLLLAHAFRYGWNKKLIGILYFFGIAGFLGAAFSRVFDSVFWQIFYFLILIGSLFLAVYAKNRSILAISVIFLIAHISYITNEYFADSIGWPVSLVILGLAFIGCGYMSIAINKNYIKK